MLFEKGQNYFPILRPIFHFFLSFKRDMWQVAIPILQLRKSISTILFRYLKCKASIFDFLFRYFNHKSRYQLLCFDILIVIGRYQLLHSDIPTFAFRCSVFRLRSFGNSTIVIILLLNYLRVCVECTRQESRLVNPSEGLNWGETGYSWVAIPIHQSVSLFISSSVSFVLLFSPTMAIWWTLHHCRSK